MKVRELIRIMQALDPDQDILAVMSALVLIGKVIEAQ